MLDFTQEKYNNWSELCNLLDQLRTAIREKRRGKLSKGVLLQQDNSRIHTCKVAMDAVERNGYELIPHPAYLPDLDPSNFFLFPNLKKDTRGCHFRSDEAVLMVGEEWVNGKDPDFFSSGLMPLEHRWCKCITLDSIPIYPPPQNLACTPKNDEVLYMLLYIEGTKIRNKTKCTPNFKMQWEPC